MVSATIARARAVRDGMSLSDPLTLLREHTINKKPITLTADHVVFGTTRFARSALTAYRERNGAGEYYPTASLAFLLQNRADSHPVFVRKCGQENIKAVTFTDRRQLLQYLDGQLETCAAVDYEKYERPQPEEVSDEAAAEPGKVDEDAMVIDEEDEAERVEAQARKEQELAAAKEAFAQMLQDPKGSSAKVKPEAEAAAGGEAAAATEVEATEAGAEAGGEAAAAAAAAAEKPIARAKVFIKEDREKTRAIVKREKRLRSRKSILLSQSMPEFPLITQARAARSPEAGDGVAGREGRRRVCE